MNRKGRLTEHDQTNRKLIQYNGKRKEKKKKIVSLKITILVIISVQ